MRQVAAGLTPARDVSSSPPKVTAKLGRKSQTLLTRSVDGRLGHLRDFFAGANLRE